MQRVTNSILTIMLGMAGAVLSAVSPMDTTTSGSRQSPNAGRPSRGGFTRTKAVSNATVTPESRPRSPWNVNSIPGYFIPNQPDSRTGRRLVADEAVTAFLQTSRGRVHFTGAGAYIGVRLAETKAEAGEGTDRYKASVLAETGEASNSSAVVMRMGFATRTKVGIIAELMDPAPGQVNFLVGPQDCWRRHLPAYRRLVYRNVWPGVDLEYRGFMDRLEYRLLVGASADPARIVMETGAAALTLDQNGNLRAGPAGGHLTMTRPAAWQEIGGERRNISVEYTVQAEGRYGFQLSGYRPGYPLVIAPVVHWSTFLGGGNEDAGQAIAVTAGGDVVIAGHTYSEDFPLTAGSVANAYGGNGDVFVCRLNSAGNFLDFATFLGGSALDQGLALALDTSGNAYVTGVTYSADFPVTSGSVDPAFNGGTDAFVAVLDSTGSDLLYSTFIGGSGFDSGHGIAVNGSGEAFVTGSTTSADFPVTMSVWDTSYGGGADAFVTRLNASGSAFIYATYLGGGNFDAGNSIVVNTASNAFVTGATSSEDFPVSTGAADPTHNGQADAYITELKPNGSGLVYSTFLGGGESDTGTGIAVDSGGNFYITGWTVSPDFPLTAAAFQTEPRGGDAFLVKLSPATDFVFSTLLGGSGSDEAHGLALDSSGAVCVIGQTSSPDFPTTSGAFDRTFNGGTDAFLARVNSQGTGLEYSTFIGGSKDDAGSSVALDLSHNAYITGSTASADYPAVPGTYDQDFNGGRDAFITSFNPSGNLLLNSTFIGGGGYSLGAAIARDSGSGVYIAGETSSWNFPNWPGFTPYTGKHDAFVTKLNAITGEMVYGTFIGGTDEDSGAGIAVNATGEVYLTGTTRSDDFPTSVVTFDNSYNGGAGDAFFVKLSADGTYFEYATYLGGSSTDGGAGIAVDGAGYAYVTGDTQSGDFPSTAGAYQAVPPGSRDAFVVKLSPAGSALTYATFLGGSASDDGRAIAVDGNGYAFITGVTSSANFPHTPSVWDGSLGGSTDAFVTRLNQAGSGLVYSTFLGGSSSDYGNDIAVDSSGAAFVTGQTFSTDFPTTFEVFDSSYNTGSDAFVTQLNAAGNQLVYSTFLGGSATDIGHGLAVDAAGQAAVTGSTNSYDYPTVFGSGDTTGDGSDDVFVTELDATGAGLVYSTYLGGRNDDRGFDIAMDAAGGLFVTGMTNSPDFPTREDASDPDFDGTFEAFAAYLQLLPPAPSDLVASAVSTSQIDLTWTDNSADESGFLIQRKITSSGAWTLLTTRLPDTTSYPDTGLQANTYYYYRVMATGAGGDSAWSNEAVAVTQNISPDAPTNLQAAAASATAINLTWQDNAENEAGFRIEQRLGTTGTWWQIATVGTDVTAYQATGLWPSTRYYYRIRAYNDIGNSAYTSEIHATTLVDSAPLAPSGLTATAVSSTQIDLFWKDNSSNETGFKIERKAGATGSFVQVATPGATETRYSDKALPTNQTYTYRIRAANSGGNSATSNEAAATLLSTTLSAPTALWATSVSASQINLFWTDNAATETGFRIDRRTGTGGNWTQITTLPANATGYANTGLTTNTTYFYRVRAYLGSTNSAYSNDVSARTNDYSMYIPAAAHTAGAGTTIWRSDLDLLNPQAAAATVEIALLRKDQANTSPSISTQSVPAGQAVSLNDVLGGTPFSAGNAALAFRFPSGSAAVNSRFYNTGGAAGTYGMSIEGADDSVVVCGDSGQTRAYFHQIKYSPDPNQGYRSNVGFVNASSFNVQVVIRLYGDSGEFLGARSQVLLPYEHRQFTEIHRGLNTPAVTHGYITVEAVTAGGKVHAYAMVIDNLSGDPVYMPAVILSR